MLVFYIIYSSLVYNTYNDFNYKNIQYVICNLISFADYIILFYSYKHIWV